MTNNLADIPGHLLKRERDDKRDRRRAIELCRFIEANMNYRPALIEVWDEKVRRGLAKQATTATALELQRTRRERAVSRRRDRQRVAA